MLPFPLPIRDLPDPLKHRHVLHRRQHPALCLQRGRELIFYLPVASVCCGMFHRVMEQEAAPVKPDEMYHALLASVEAERPGIVFVLADPIDTHPLSDGFMCVAMSKLRQDSGASAYEAVAHLRLSTQAKRKLPKSSLGRQANGSTLEAVLAALNELPERTAVFVPQIHEIWVGRDESPPKETMSSWTASQARVQRQNDRAGHALTRVIPALVTLAKERQLLIVSICTLNKSIWETLPIDVQKLDGFCFANITSSSDELYDSFEQRMMAILSETKAGQRTFEDAEKELRSTAPSEVAAKQAVAHLLSRVGRHHEAWIEISHILPQLAPTEVPLMMALAKMALDALDVPACEEWIGRARSTGITQLQDWALAVQLAQAMEDRGLEAALMGDMTGHFPDHELVVSWQLRKALSAGNITESVSLVRRQGRHDLGNALQAIVDREPIPVVVRYAHDEQDRNLALLAMVYARAADNPSLAWAALKRISSTAVQRVTALCFWWNKWSEDAVTQEGPSHATSPDGRSRLHDLTELIDASLMASREVNIRHAISDALMSSLAPGVAENYLVTLLIPELLTSARLAHSKPWTLVIDLNGDEASEADFAAFSDAIGTEEQRSNHLFGQGNLPDSAISLVTPQIGNRLIRGLQEIAPNPASNNTTLTVLDLIAVVSRHLGDPSFDLMAALIAVSGIAQAGDEQLARNIAEGVLTGFPISTADSYQWRLGGAWLVVAESLVSSGGARQALVPLLFAAKSMNQNPLDAMMPSRLLDVASRALRNLGRTNEAIQVNRLERELLQGRDQEFLLARNRHYGLILQVSGLDPMDAISVQSALDDVMQEVRELNESEERAPLLWMAANLVQFLRCSGANVPSVILYELKRLSDLESRYSAKSAHLKRFLSGELSVEWLIGELERSTRAVRVEDADAQFGRLAMLARSGFEQALRDSSDDLALTVLATRCQPALLGRKQSLATNQDRAARAYRENLADLVRQDPTRSLTDEIKALEERGAPRLIEVDWQKATSPDHVREILSTSEKLIGLCMLNDHSLGVIEISAHEGVRLSRRSSDEWSEIQWEASRHYLFDRLAEHARPELLMSIVEKPLLHLDGDTKHVTFIPETSLFGLPLAMALGQTTFHSPSVSIAPSTAWLNWARSMEPRLYSGAKAWLGHAVDDVALLALHEDVRPTLAELGLEIVPELSRGELGGASIAVVSAHGVVNASNEVVGISDDTNLWSSAYLAKALEQCQCVILACCSLGTGDKPAGSNESWSVVAAMLAEGVRCVIAPVWPIYVPHLNNWLRALIPLLHSGHTVADGVKQANLMAGNSLQGKFAFQVFGDGLVRLAL